jgi:hypothetical protein
VNYRILSVLFGVLAVSAISTFWQPVLAVETEGRKIDCDLGKDNCVGDDNPRNPDTEIEILSPSANTELLTQTPSISWSAVEGTTYYIIRVQDLEKSETMQEKTVDLSEVEVGEDGTIAIDYLFDRPLSPETEYQIIIETEIETVGEEKIISGEVIFSTQ